MGSEKDKLDDLSERIRRAEEDAHPKPKPMESNTRHNAGYDFAGSILGAVIFGVLLDRLFGTAPWILVGCLLLGFAAGVLGLWRSMQTRDDDKDDKET